MECVETLEIEIPFFEWYTNRKNLEEQCLVLNQKNFKTYKSSKGDETRTHPPPRKCKIKYGNETSANDNEIGIKYGSSGNNNENLECLPFILFDEELSSNIAASAHQIGVIMKQNNYTNEYLTTIGDQLDRIENNQSSGNLILSQGIGTGTIMLTASDAL